MSSNLTSGTNILGHGEVVITAVFGTAVLGSIPSVPATCTLWRVLLISEKVTVCVSLKSGLYGFRVLRIVIVGRL